jgi:predicted nucleotidyltransferase
MTEKDIGSKIPGRVLRDIIRFARKNSVDRLVLFGSRARGTNQEHSDIDLAVYGGYFDRFYDDIQEKTWSLLKFDLIDMSRAVSDELKQEINRDGVIIYEKD